MRYSVLYFHCRLRRCIAGPFSPDMQVSSHMFAITHDARLIITAGHWDNSLRVFATRSKQLTRIVGHTGKFAFTVNKKGNCLC